MPVEFIKNYICYLFIHILVLSAHSYVQTNEYVPCAITYQGQNFYGEIENNHCKICRFGECNFYRLCRPTCINSKCINGDTCQCYSGYVASRHVPNTCKPYCPRGCDNGHCIAPYKCACNEGYVPGTENNTNQCVSVCSKMCVNGTCNAKNLCFCKLGHIKAPESAYVCVPHVRPPLTNPNSTFEGSVGENASMVSEECPERCINATCENKACRCHEGYAFYMNSTNACVIIANMTVVIKTNTYYWIWIPILIIILIISSIILLYLLRSKHSFGINTKTQKLANTPGVVYFKPETTTRNDEVVQENDLYSIFNVHQQPTVGEYEGIYGDLSQTGNALEPLTNR